MTLIAESQTIIIVWVRASALCVASRPMLSTESVRQAVPAVTATSGYIRETAGIVAWRFRSVRLVASGVVAHAFNRKSIS